MPPRLTKPASVPQERKNLVDLLWRFYVAAQRPPTRRIAETIEAWENRRGSANHETVRRTLRGEAVGAWWTVEVIFLALCEIADVDPHDIEDDDYDGRFGTPPVSHLEQCRRFWNEALDGAPMPDIPRTRTARDEQEAAAKAEAEYRAQARRSASFDDEPPF